jgi:3-hexulose-6-phosphate synthase
MESRKVKLQIALDFYTLEEAAACAQKLVDVIDILEVGTPLLLGEGMHAVRTMRELDREITLVADTKIMDGGYGAAELAFAAGADIVTVLGAANDVTISDTIRAAEKYQGKIMVDLINVPNPAQRAEEVVTLGADYLLFHLPTDLAAQGQGFELKGVDLSRYQAAVAGGLNAGNVGQVLTLTPSIVIVGSAVYKAEDPRGEALKLKELLN